ncbi:MAG: ABC transporter ATP-binding protein [Pseudomonadota bacterium]|nr:ABC transporter ATP-binding protein [Pseudomonadota bacterium]
MRGVEVRDLVKSFGAVRAVDGVSFSVPAGGITTMLGPSGCGKTTILRCIAGLETATSGEIAIGDRTVFSGGVSRVPVERRNLGMVFQSYAIWPHMTIADNVAYGLRVRGWSRAEKDKRVREALALVRLSGFEARLPGQLSGGQMQRVVLARAIAYDPEILLLDEPLANLDAHLREEMRQELKRIQRETGTTMIAVTHDQSEALAISDQILVMSMGQILQAGTPAEIWQRPAGAEVARFLGGVNDLEAIAVDDRIEVPELGILTTGVAATRGRCRAIFRPADARIAAPAMGEGLAGKVVLSQFLGQTVQYLVRCGGQEIIVDAPASGGVLADGTAVSVSVASGALMVFPESAAA